MTQAVLGRRHGAAVGDGAVHVVVDVADVTDVGHEAAVHAHVAKRAVRMLVRMRSVAVEFQVGRADRDPAGTHRQRRRSARSIDRAQGRFLPGGSSVRRSVCVTCTESQSHFNFAN